MNERFDAKADVPRANGEGMTRRAAGSRILHTLLGLAIAGVYSRDADAQQPKAPSAPKAKREKGPARKREVVAAGPRSLRDILRDQLRQGDSVTVDDALAENVRRIWEREYRVAALPKAKPEDPRVGVLDSILERMNPFLPQLRDAFKKHGVPEWCMYLSIVESRFRTDLVSEAGAVGPFQFIEETGATYGLVEYDKDRKVVRDDRTDVLKSADACARLLKDNFAIYTRRGASPADAWKFATHQYNGSFAHLYALRHANGTPTYAGFLAFMQERMNMRLTRAREATEHVVQQGESLGTIARRNRLTLAQILAANPEIKNANVIQPGAIIKIPALADDAPQTYTVREGDTLSKIARHLGTTVVALKEANKLTSDTIAIGAQIVIPPDARFVAEIAIRDKISRLGGLVQNLEYTLKLEGLLRVLKERGIVSDIP